MNKGEAWKPVPDWEGLYEVSDSGRVRSLDRVVEHSRGPRRRKGKVLTPDQDVWGYLRVSLHRDGVGTARKVHTLVLRAFVGAPPAGLEGCHDNGKPADNQLKNLRWDTHANNCADKLSHGTDARGARNGRCRLTESQAYRAKFGSARAVDLAREFGVSPRLISKIRTSKTWAWLQPTEDGEMAALVAWVNNLPEGDAA